MKTEKIVNGGCHAHLSSDVFIRSFVAFQK